MRNQPTLAEAAARYAAAGWPVHPLHDTTAGHCSCDAGPDGRQAGKHPRTTHGFHDATIKPRTVTGWDLASLADTLTPDGDTAAWVEATLPRPRPHPPANPAINLFPEPR